MSPLLIEIVFHYFCRADDYREGDFSAPAVREGINWLRDDAKLIEPNNDQRASNAYRVTERGHAYVKALLSVPFPIQVWVMPETYTRCSRETAHD